MRKRVVSGVILAFLLTSLFTLGFRVQQVKADPTTWSVDADGPADFSSIQQAINSPLVAAGDRIFVYSGTYYENVVVNKTVSLIGENTDTTIIDGFSNVVKVTAHDIVFSNFTVRGTGLPSMLILLEGTANNIIAFNNLMEKEGGFSIVTGIAIYSSSNTTLAQNKLKTRNGIMLSDSFNNTVTGNILTQAQGVAIGLYSSMNNRVIGNNVTGKEYPPYGFLGTGVLLNANRMGNAWKNGSSYNVFSDNNIRNCGTAIYAYPTPAGAAEPYRDNILLRNSIEDDSGGLYMSRSVNFTFRDNVFSGNAYNIGIYGSNLPEYTHNIDTSNTVNGKPVYYLVNQKNLKMDPLAFPSIGYLALINSTNITVENLNLKENWQGLLMVSTQNSTILYNDIANNLDFGIYMDILNSNNTISKNNIVGQTGSSFFSQTGAGILSKFSFNNSLTLNTISNNQKGIYLKTSFNNTLAVNTITNNSHGGIWLDYSFNNALVSNNIISNGATALSDAGISLYQSYTNKIFHNNFINNQRQAYTPLGNFWDDGYPSGGNYWSDYITKYPDAHELDDSGIWDTPYAIDGNNRDLYPLMNPWTPPPTVIAATIEADPDSLNLRSQGKWITAYIQLPEGYEAADIDVSSILLNGTISPILDTKYGFVTNSSEYLVDHNNDGILERMVKLNRTAVESWIYNTQGIKYGDIVLQITGEMFDGTRFEATTIVFVNYAGDINNDGKIDMIDVSALSAHWSRSPEGHLGYDANADLNSDGVINILDRAIVSGNWGQTVP